MEPGSLFAFTAVVAAVAMSLLWLLSLVLKDASIVDMYWGPGFGVIATAAFLYAGDGDRATLALVLTLAWGLRLGAYLFWRNVGEGEDPRYQAMRRYWGARFPWVSLVTVFALQGTLMWFVSLPVQVTIASEPTPLGAFDLAGALLFCIGLGFESVGDFQLARFKALPDSAGKVMDRGLWRYTRHPNYFGDCLVWWGLFTISLSTAAGPYTILSPVVMTVFLLKVSGVALLERSIVKRRPQYAAYIERTSAFVPMPPRG